MRTSPESRPESAVNCTDGYVGLNINPRKPGRQGGFDHFGFQVDDLDAFQANAKRIGARNQQLAPRAIDAGPEGEVRLRLLATCRYGDAQLSDPDCVLLDVRQASNGGQAA